MKVRITGHSGPEDEAPSWYVDHIGEVFEVERDEQLPQYYYTIREFKGMLEKHHIRVEDCEVVS